MPKVKEQQKQAAKLRFRKKRSGFIMKYTCSEYREEMILAGLRRRLQDGKLSAEEKEHLRRQIRRLEAEMGLA